MYFYDARGRRRFLATALLFEDVVIIADEANLGLSMAPGHQVDRAPQSGAETAVGADGAAGAQHLQTWKPDLQMPAPFEGFDPPSVDGAVTSGGDTSIGEVLKFTVGTRPEGMSDVDA